MAVISKMTEAELREFIEKVIDERLATLLGTFDEPEDTDPYKDMTWDEVRAYIESHRLTPPPGAKSSLELLREDRDR